MIEIPLTRGKVAWIDDEDWELVSQYKWFARTAGSGIFYANTSLPRNLGNQRCLIMHRLIMNAQPGQIIDHRDGNGLNNQKENLRFCTQMENLQNKHVGYGTSKYKGVAWYKAYSKWCAEITHNKKRISLGYFDTEEEAALAYNKAALELFGEFASLNFITPDFEEI